MEPPSQPEIRYLCMMFGGVCLSAAYDVVLSEDISPTLQVAEHVKVSFE